MDAQEFRLEILEGAQYFIEVDASSQTSPLILYFFLM